MSKKKEKKNEEVVEVAPLDREQADRQRLMNYTVKDLKAIAENLGADGATLKADLVNNILAKVGGQQKSTVDAPTTEEVDAEIEVSLDEFEGEDKPQPCIKHFMATAGPLTMRDRGIFDWLDLDYEISKWFARGYNPIEFQAVGTLPEGHRLLYVFQKGKPLFTEAHHVVRVLTKNPNPSVGSISGFQADIYISSFIEDGWTLVGARYNGVANEGIYMAWLLAR